MKIFSKKQTENNLQNNNNNKRPPLKIIPIGGTTTVQKNMYVYESGNDIIVFDCGIGFPGMEEPGVDIIIPDFSYILENREKVRGIVITHGHEDHRSSLPYLLKEYRFDVYAVPFVKALIEKAVEEHKGIEDYKVKVIDPDKPFSLGVFKIHPFRVNHSIPDTLGFAIDTPQGRVFHNTDFKFDWTPVMDKPFEIQKAAVLASEPKHGVLALLSDCLGVTSNGYARSETNIQNTFEKLFAETTGKQVFITTVSSNISRIKQAIDASIKFNRKIVVSGRSLRNTIEVARDIRYIDFPENVFVDERKAHSYNQGKLTYIITGAYGQKGSGLWRVAFNDHKQIHLDEGAAVIFSADPIPTSMMSVNALINELYSRNAIVYYSEIQANLHVSGHGSRGDIMLLANIVKPKYYIPIGGNIKHMRAYSKMMQSLGTKEENILQLLDGQSVIFENGKVRLGEKLKLKEVYVDGTLVGDVGNAVLEDRIQMGEDGMIVVVVNGNNIDIVSRGFVFVKSSKKLIADTHLVVKKCLTNTHDSKEDKLRYKIENEVSRFLYKRTGRKPLVLVSVNAP